MIGLCDCNSFYASCELLFRPDLKDKGIMVLSNNDGIVVALNQRAKALGFKRGDAKFNIEKEAEKKGCIFFSSNYSLYANISSRVITTLSELTYEVDPYSIDEAFFLAQDDIDAVKLRNTIIKNVGIPVSIGIARTKTLAKIANHLGKKMEDGAIILTEDKEEEILRATPIEDVWGIGRRTALKLRTKGINNAYAFSILDESWVKNTFNITLLRTQQELKGKNAVIDGETDRSFCSGISFKEPIISFNELFSALCAQAQILSLKLESKELIAKTFIISVFNSRFKEGYYAPFETINFEEQTNYLPKIIAEVKRALRKIYIPTEYKGCRIFACNLTQKGTIQYSLFDTEQDIKNYNKNDKLNETVNEISKKYGRSLLVPASMLGVDKTNLCKREMKSPSYTTRFEELPTID